MPEPKDFDLSNLPTHPDDDEVGQTIVELFERHELSHRQGLHVLIAITVCTIASLDDIDEGQRKTLLNELQALSLRLHPQGN